MQSRTLVKASLATAVILSIVAVNLWRDLRAARDLTVSIQTHEPATQRIESREMSAPVESIERNGAEHVASSAGTPVDVRQELVSSAGSSSIENESRALGDRERLNDPDFREARRAEIRMALVRQYSGVIEDLLLTPNEAAQLFDLLADYQIQDRSAPSVLPTGGRPNPSALRERIAAQQESQSRLRDNLVSLLGNDRYQGWLEFRDSLPDRERVNQFQALATSVGYSLSDSQSKSLITIFSAESKRQREERVPLQGNDSRSVEEYRAMTLNQGLEGNRRIIQAASPQLSIQQLDVLEEMLAQEQRMYAARAQIRDVQ